MVVAALLFAIGSCGKDEPPVSGDDWDTGKITVSNVIFEPKVGAPGDTILFTAVVTSPAENQGDFPVYDWSASGGTFADSNKQSVRWVAPGSSGLFIITVKATNDLGSSTNHVTAFIGAGQTLIDDSAGQVDLLGTGPDFHFLHTSNVKVGADIWRYVGGVASDVIVQGAANNRNVAYSRDGLFAAYAADTFKIAVTVPPRNIYLADLNGTTINRITFDTARPGSPERNVYNYPSFSPNGQVVAYQAWQQSWDGSAPDSFHVYIYDRVAQKRTKVTYEHAFPRGFFPTFSTDGQWLVYILDKNRNSQWDLYASPMTGNSVDGSIASLVRMTSTGGQIVSGAPKDLKRPPMDWNPVQPILAIAAADNVLYLVATNATGSIVTPVSQVTKATEVAWSPDGSLLAATYTVTVGEETHIRVATVTPAGVATDRMEALAGDNVRDLAFSPDAKWLVCRITRGAGAWFSAIDVGAGKVSSPVPVTPTDLTGSASDYRSAMSLQPAWTSANHLIYPTFLGSSATPGIAERDLSGLVD